MKEEVDMRLRELLIQSAKILNKHGPDSPEIQEFLRSHRENQELVELVELSRTLKREVDRRTSQAGKGKAGGGDAPSASAFSAGTTVPGFGSHLAPPSPPPSGRKVFRRFLGAFAAIFSPRRAGALGIQQRDDKPK
jgi:hypothetical protein